MEESRDLANELVEDQVAESKSARARRKKKERFAKALAMEQAALEKPAVAAGDYDANPARSETHSTSNGDTDHETRPTSSGNDSVTGISAPKHIPRHERPPTTDGEWHDVDDSAMPVSMEQLTGESEPGLIDETSPRFIINTWFQNQAFFQIANITLEHQTKILEHFLNFAYPGTTPNWTAVLRQYVWRTVIRANYFWLNPETGKVGEKPKPVHRPDGIYENDFNIWLMCVAERSDRVGRDIPTHEHVTATEADVRAFLTQVEGLDRQVLARLAFLVLFDEQHKRGLKVEDLRERVKKALGAEWGRVDWEGCRLFQPAVAGGKAKKMPENMEKADRLWVEFVKMGFGKEVEADA